MVADRRIHLKYLEKKNAVIFRLGTVYGLSDTHSRLRMDLVVNLLTARAYTQGTIVVFGGEQHRPLIHVKDVALGIEKVIDSDICGVFNLHSFNTTVIELAEVVKSHFPGLVVKPTGVTFQDNRTYRVTSEKAERLFYFRPRYVIDDGVREIKELLESGRIKNAFVSRYSNVEHLRNSGEDFH